MTSFLVPALSRLSPIRDLIAPVFRDHALRASLGLATLIAVDALQLLIPKFVQRAIDALAAGSAEPGFLAHIADILVIIGLLMAALRFVWRYLLIGFSRILEQRLRDQLFAKLLLLDQPFFERRTPGDIMAHASNDLSVIQLAFGMGVVGAVDIVVLTLVALFFMLTISPLLTLIVLAPMPVLALCVKKLAAMLHRRVSRVQEEFSELTEAARATIEAARLIKAYTLERFQARRFAALGERYVASNLAVARVQGLLAPTTTLVASAGMLLLLFFGGRFVIDGRVSIGAFVAFVSYLSALIWPLMAIGWVANIAQRGLTSLRRVQEILAARPVVSGATDTGTEPAPGPIHISLRDLSFTYPGAVQPALANINLAFGPGLTGLAGRTGSGKSTLMKLLARIYPLADNMLFVQDADVNTLSLQKLRSRIAWAGQEVFLFADSVAANIALGKPDATMDEIRAAARLAAIDNEIMAFPGGYEAAIGERGVKLSGGQKQRIALARALLCKRPVLLIDDGLSAVDVETEREILANLRHHITGNTTVLLVSHRVNLLRHCDRIVILDQGRISATGTHEELASHPFYRVMLEKQKHHA